ncbi:ABC transporter permease [Mycolicibacterium komossense]|uniref:Transport permease protein n=1 Tax=Mycolicibacterium komossense TaxID=1779 RepID=A0ABT3CKT8_9MYCO|nr:ABC transporter permease [Mycolicibacterium komossense]MCV7230128.1 ABC transporter permease [Mycolicibacterium komossense]
MAVVKTFSAPLRAHNDGAYWEDSPRHLVSHTWVLTARLLVRLVRNPVTIVHALILPVGFLLTLDVVLGDSITAATGEDALYRSVPLVALLAAISGSSAGMVGITTERLDGFLARMWVLPVHRAAGLSARLFAEIIRLVATTLVILVTGLILGFRFHQGPTAALAWVAAPVVFGVAFSAVVTMIALYWPKAVLVEAIQIVGMVGTFFCTGLVPVDKYPDWVQPLVRYQPMSTAVDAMRGLSVGGPVLTPMLGTLAWSAGIFAVCLWPIMVGYRRASTSR